jgi:hypothetical protein
VVLEPLERLDESHVSPGHERPHTIVVPIFLPPQELQAQRESPGRPTATQEDPLTFGEGHLDAVGQAIDLGGVSFERLQGAEVDTLEHRDRCR